MNPLAIAILITAGILIGMLANKYMYEKRKKDSLSSTLIASRLEDCSELTTCNLKYVDLVKYAQGSIPLVTKKSFSMIYEADIRAGIDLSKAVIDVARSTVTITLPETEVQSISVNTASLRFYDERWALFNWSNKEDIASAIEAARADAEAHANLDELKMQARNQAEIVVRKLVGPAVEGYRDLIIK